MNLSVIVPACNEEACLAACLHSIQPTARRLQVEGFFRTAARCAVNFVSEALLKRPLTTDHRDIR